MKMNIVLKIDKDVKSVTVQNFHYRLSRMSSKWIIGCSMTTGYSISSQRYQESSEHWRPKFLFKRPTGGENLEYFHTSNYPGKAPLYFFPNKYLNHHHDERSIPGNIYVSEADVLIP